MNTEDKNADNGNGNNRQDQIPTAPAEGPRIITRRKAIVGGVSALALGVLGARKAAAQTTGLPLVVAGGLSQGRMVKLGAADATTWMQNMLSSNSILQFVYNYFTGQGYSFILQRSNVYVHSASTAVVEGSTPVIAPNILGILPSFVPVNQSDPSHTAVGICIDQQGNLSVASVVVSHNPYAIQQFTIYDYVPGTPPVFQPHTITATDLQNMTVCEAANMLGVPPGLAIPANSAPAGLAQSDASALVAMTYQAILSDSYAAPLYPPAGFQSMVAQAPLIAQFGAVAAQRINNGLGGTPGITCCTSTSSNACTSCSSSFTVRLCISSS